MQHSFPHLPAVYDEKRRRLTESSDAFFAPPGRGKSHALYCQVEASVNAIQDERIRARVLVYCALGRLQPDGEPVPDGVNVTRTLDLADAWGDDDGLYTVVRTGITVGDRPATVRDILRLCEPGYPTLLYVDEMGLACADLTARQRAELARVMSAGRGGLPELGIGPVILRCAAQQPSQIHPSIRTQITRQWYGPYPGTEAGAGIPAVRHLPRIDADPWGSFYSPATGIVRLATDYDKAMIRASHGADWGARR